MSATDPTGAAQSLVAQPSRPSQSVEALIHLAEQLSLEDVDIDELVYDTVHADASRLVNNGARPELNAIDAFDTLHNEADDNSSRINNEGLEAQIRTLVSAHGDRGTEALLRDSAH